MKLLLDTHSLLWFALGEPRLSLAARDAIESADHTKWISPASFWETTIKVSLGKYSVPGRLDEFFAAAVEGNGFSILPIELRHVQELVGLSHHHRDPFDRLLVAQATIEGMSIVSSDAALDAYGVDRVWK
ncbi:MAG: type II toxin-antitoxin system VapC family toxin [Lacipirellulaceae bacterium]